MTVVTVFLACEILAPKGFLLIHYVQFLWRFFWTQSRACEACKINVHKEWYFVYLFVSTEYQTFMTNVWMGHRGLVLRLRSLMRGSSKINLSPEMDTLQWLVVRAPSDITRLVIGWMNVPGQRQ